MNLPIDHIRAEALCEACGAWHKVTIRPTDNEFLTGTIRPSCWQCGHTPLVVIENRTAAILSLLRD